MSRFVFTTLPASGHMNPTIAIAQRLRDQGHNVAYVTHPRAEAQLQRAGLELLPGLYDHLDLNQIGPVHVDEQGHTENLPTRNPRDSLADFFRDLKTLTANLINILREWRPDAIVTDQQFYPTPLAAELLDLPYATLSSIVQIENVLSRPLRLMFPSVSPMLFGLADQANNAARTYFGLKPVTSAFFTRSPYLYLAFTTDEFEGPFPVVTPQTFYIGPTPTLLRGDETNFPWEWLEQDSRRKVYASLGTLASIDTARRFFRKVIQASTDQNWQMIIATGNVDPADLGALPENVRAFKFVPQLAMIEKMDAVISHGGNNTVTESLYFGKPIIVVPMGADQPFNATRITQRGVGIRLNVTRVTSASLREAIHKIIGELRYRDRAELIMRSFRRSDGTATAAALLTILAQTKQPLSRPIGIKATVTPADVERYFGIPAREGDGIRS